ncbi:PAAR domain-containing protein [Cupriavidus campinensis]
MKSPIRLGDELEHGGQVTSASPTMTFMGRPVARKGDSALCARHGATTIAEAHEGFSDQDGKPIAMHHHRCACGCRLISSLQSVHIA